MCAVIGDLSKMRISNLLILSGLISGIFYRMICLGERHYLLLVLGILFPVILFFPLFLLRAMGAGDIKLMAVTGAFFTIRENLKCIVIAILLGGVIALIKLLFYKNLRQRFQYMFTYMRNVVRCAAVGNFYAMPYMDLEDGKMVENAGIKFSLPILLGAIVVMGGSI